MLVSTAKLARQARENGYAVPAVNVFDGLSMRAVIAAAEAASAPLIIQVSVKTLRDLGAGRITSMFRDLVRDVTIPVALHLDHCPDRSVIDQVLAERWSSVLFDASDRELVDAERETAEVVAAAHAVGVDVESEIENIVGIEDGVGSDVAVHSYEVEQLAAVAKRTGVDLLAPQLGTAHGEYRSSPNLLPERAGRLARLSDLPIVLHGGTGLTEEQFGEFIDAGVSKINISTAVKLSYMKAAAEHLDTARRSNKWDPPSLFSHVRRAVEAEIVQHIRSFRAEGRAHEALTTVTAS